MPRIIKDVGDKEVRKFLEHYLELIAQLYSPSEMWVFGSRVSGNPNELSDIDLIVVSEKFARMPFFKRRSRFLMQTGLARDLDIEVIDPLCYTPEEFETKKRQLCVVSEALNSGVRVL